MTTTTILNTGDSQTVDVAELLVPDKGNFALIDTISKDDGSREAIYQKISGSEEYPMTVRVGYYRNAKANGGVGGVNLSVKIVTYAEKVDIDDVIWTLPAAITLAMSMPGGTPIPDQEDIIELIGNALGWLLPVDTGAISSAALDELKFGVVNGLLAHANSASV
jgi:hypothetical protein